MSVRKHLYRNVSTLAIVLALLPGSVFTSSQLAAQRRDRRDRQATDAPVPSRKNEKGPRAVAVIEWKADARGRATPRLVPVLILDGGRFYDASLYRATPVPMALESGTVYEAQDGGEILGYFTIKGAARVNGQATAANTDSDTDDRPWIGLGDWKSAAPKLDLFTNRPQHAEVVKPGAGSQEQTIADNNGTPKGEDGSTRQKATVYNEEGKEEPQDANNGRPTLKRRSKDKEGTPRVSPPEPKKTNPDDDPDRPRLKRQTSPSSPVDASPPASSSAGDSAPASPQPAAGTSSPPKTAGSATSETSSGSSNGGVDSDRPVLRRGTTGEQVKASSDSPSDTERPVLKHGGEVKNTSARSPAPVADKKSASTKTTLGPTVPQRVIDRGTREPDETKSVSLRTRTYEAVAISDAHVPENPPIYKHRWEGDEESEVTRKMAALAESEVRNFLRMQAQGSAEGLGRLSVPGKAQHKSGTASSSSTTRSTSQSDGNRQQLEDVRVFALDISSNNSAEIVFTARQRQTASRWLYITMVARMDLTGNPRKLFTSVTSSDRLDSVPRLEFIDAVDVDGDGRAELLFRAVNGSDAEFLVYRVGPDKLTEIFHGGQA